MLNKNQLKIANHRVTYESPSLKCTSLEDHQRPSDTNEVAAI